MVLRAGIFHQELIQTAPAIRRGSHLPMLRALGEECGGRDRSRDLESVEQVRQELWKAVNVPKAERRDQHTNSPADDAQQELVGFCRFVG